MRNIGILALFLFCSPVYSVYIDLSKGGEVMQTATCIYNKKVYLCAHVLYQGNHYIVFADEQGEYMIFHKTEKETKLLWARDSV